MTDAAETLTCTAPTAARRSPPHLWHPVVRRGPARYCAHLEADEYAAFGSSTAWAGSSNDLSATQSPRGPPPVMVPG